MDTQDSFETQLLFIQIAENQTGVKRIIQIGLQMGHLLIANVRVNTNKNQITILTPSFMGI